LSGSPSFAVCITDGHGLRDDTDRSPAGGRVVGGPVIAELSITDGGEWVRSWVDESLVRAVVVWITDWHGLTAFTDGDVAGAGSSAGSNNGLRTPSSTQG
jgi:hypothetical protein